MWFRAICECSICGHRQVSVFPAPKDVQAPIIPLECAGCHNMTAQPVCGQDDEDEEDEGDFAGA